MELVALPVGSSMDEGEVTFVVDEGKNTVQRLANGTLSAPVGADVSDTNIRSIQKEPRGTTTLQIDRVSGSGTETFEANDRSGAMILRFKNCRKDNIPDLKAKI
jgi:hypothetical protein